MGLQNYKQCYSRCKTAYSVRNRAPIRYKEHFSKPICARNKEMPPTKAYNCYNAIIIHRVTHTPPPTPMAMCIAYAVSADCESLQL